MKLNKILLVLMLFVTSYGLSKSSYTKVVYNVLSFRQTVNNPIFYPLNNRVIGLNPEDNSINIDSFQMNKESIKWNLFTIMFYNILKGNLNIELGGSLLNSENLRHIKFTDNFNDDNDYSGLVHPTSKKDSTRLVNMYRNEIFGYFPSYHPYPLKSIEYEGEDSIDVNGETVYPEIKYNYYQDDQVIFYLIIEKWKYNKKMQIIDKDIAYIAPILTGFYSYTGDVMPYCPFWIKMDELMPILKNHFFMNTQLKKEKMMSLYTFFKGRIFITGDESMFLGNPKIRELKKFE
ncbi:MAG: hypothetical protein ACWA41_06700 [Putridiphycobacter sp.]